MQLAERGRQAERDATTAQVREIPRLAAAAGELGEAVTFVLDGLFDESPSDAAFRDRLQIGLAVQPLQAGGGEGIVVSGTVCFGIVYDKRKGYVYTGAAAVFVGGGVGVGLPLSLRVVETYSLLAIPPRGARVAEVPDAVSVAGRPHRQHGLRKYSG